MISVLLCVELASSAAEVWIQVDSRGGWKQTAPSRNLILGSVARFACWNHMLSSRCQLYCFVHLGRS